MIVFFFSDGLHPKTASCRLYVRLVTKEMLEKSVTIRLNNITQSTFLSPVYKFFVDALASVLNTEEKNIYVINVEKDTDVTTTVLNVSVAVRKSDGSFIDSEVLQEQIYLQRIRLAELSTLEVGIVEWFFLYRLAHFISLKDFVLSILAMFLKLQELALWYIFMLHFAFVTNYF